MFHRRRRNPPGFCLPLWAAAARTTVEIPLHHLGPSFTHTKDWSPSCDLSWSPDWRNISLLLCPMDHNHVWSVQAKEGVKMTSFGLLAHGCPPSAAAGTLAFSPLWHPPFSSPGLYLQRNHQDLCLDCVKVWLPSHFLTMFTCIHTLGFLSLSWLKGPEKADLCRMIWVLFLPGCM